MPAFLPKPDIELEWVSTTATDPLETFRGYGLEMGLGIESTRVDRWQLIVGWFLVLSYAIGSPAFAIVEARSGLFSQRFDYSPEFLYLVSGVQFVCSLVLFNRSVAPWSAIVLTALSLGAVVSHIRIDSPVTALPALVYTAIQIWYGLRMYRQHRDRAA